MIPRKVRKAFPPIIFMLNSYAIQIELVFGKTYLLMIECRLKNFNKTGNNLI